MRVTGSIASSICRNRHRVVNQLGNDLGTIGSEDRRRAGEHADRQARRVNNSRQSGRLQDLHLRFKCWRRLQNPRVTLVSVRAILTCSRRCEHGCEHAAALQWFDATIEGHRARFPRRSPSCVVSIPVWKTCRARAARLLVSNRRCHLGDRGDRTLPRSTARRG